MTFDRELKNHPAHLEALVQSDATIYSILQLINQETGIHSTKLSVFCDETRNREAVLVPQSTLQELGYEGDAYDEPQEVTLYYDYKVEFTECPILLCDHYLRDMVDDWIMDMDVQPRMLCCHTWICLKSVWWQMKYI